MVSKSINVPIQSRYAAAAMEISARLQSRQNVNLYLTTITIAGVAATWTQNGIWGVIASVLLSVFSLSFALWISHNDLILGLLGKFCETCESGFEKNNSKYIFPSWFSNQGWLNEALHFRKFSNWGTIIVLVVITSNTLLKLMFVSELSIQILLFIAAIWSGFSILLICGNKRRRLAIKEQGIYL